MNFEQYIYTIPSDWIVPIEYDDFSGLNNGTKNFEKFLKANNFSNYEELEDYIKDNGIFKLEENKDNDKFLSHYEFHYLTHYEHLDEMILKERPEEFKIKDFLNSIKGQGHWDLTPNEYTLALIKDYGKIPNDIENIPKDELPNIPKDEEQEVFFEHFHDARNFGVPSSNCLNVIYNMQIPELEKEKICVWSDYEWCYKEEIEEYLNAPMAKSDDYITVELAFDEEPTFEQLKECIDGKNYNLNYDNVVRDVIKNVDNIKLNSSNNFDIKR